MGCFPPSSWVPTEVGGPLKPLDPSKIPPPQPSPQPAPQPSPEPEPSPAETDQGFDLVTLVATGALSLVFGVLVGRFLLR